jgi:hypothetical protein
MTSTNNINLEVNYSSKKLLNHKEISENQYFSKSFNYNRDNIEWHQGSKNELTFDKAIFLNKLE